MKKFVAMKDDILFQMSKESAELAKKITPEKWAETLMQIIYSFDK
jgi:hypothetical protein